MQRKQRKWEELHVSKCIMFKNASCLKEISKRNIWDEIKLFCFLLCILNDSFFVQKTLCEPKYWFLICLILSVLHCGISCLFFYNFLFFIWLTSKRMHSLFMRSCNAILLTNQECTWHWLKSVTWRRLENETAETLLKSKDENSQKFLRC